MLSGYRGILARIGGNVCVLGLYPEAEIIGGSVGLMDRNARIMATLEGLWCRLQRLVVQLRAVGAADKATRWIHSELQPETGRSGSQRGVARARITVFHQPIDATPRSPRCTLDTDPRA